MEKIVFFADFANLDRAARDRGMALDYEHLRNYIAEGRFLVDSHCYVPIDPRNEHRVDGLIEQLWRAGYIVNTKIGTVAGGTYKCNFDVEMTMDILRVSYQLKPDIIVLGSGDSDFIPLIQELRKMGIRVEVASFEQSAARDMILKCSGFISLDYYLQEAVSPTAELQEAEESSLSSQETLRDAPGETDALGGDDSAGLGEVPKTVGELVD